MSKQSRERTRTERAAAVVADQKRAERNRNLGITAVVVVVLAVIVAAVVWSTRGGDTPATASVTPPASVSGNALVIGPASAAHKVVVYEDFQCPYCRQFENSSRDFLAEAADKGKVQVEYRPFNLLTADDYSARALSAFAVVLQNGTPAQALKLHNILYDKQPYEDASSKPDTAQLRKWAEQAGASAAVVAKIGSVDQTYVSATNSAAQAAGVTGTPTVLLDGTKVQASSISGTADAIEKAIGG